MRSREAARVERSNIYHVLCMSCFRAEDLLEQRQLNHFRQGQKKQVGARGAPLNRMDRDTDLSVTMSSCKTPACTRMTPGSSLCLFCARDRQQCLSCGALLEVTFYMAAKRNSFLRFPLSFRQEVRQLLLVSHRFRWTRDIRLLLVKSLASLYELPRTHGPMIYSYADDLAHVEVFEMLGQPWRVYVHVFNLTTKAGLMLPSGIRYSRNWTVSDNAKRLQPAQADVGDRQLIRGLTGSSFCVDFSRSFNVDGTLQPLICSFEFRHPPLIPDSGHVEKMPPDITVQIQFQLRRKHAQKQPQ